MVLIELIEWLEKQDRNAVVPNGFSSPHSDRGYYHNLAFTPQSESRIQDMLAHAKGALGRTFEGYKGGQYTMGEHTEVFIGEYGECGEEINSYTIRYWEDAIKNQ